jgi:hypothetical protein
MHSLIGKEEAYRGKYNYGKPHAHNRDEDMILCKFFSENIQKVEDHKEDQGGDQWKTQATLPDNGAQGGTYEKQDQACNGK